MNRAFEQSVDGLVNNLSGIKDNCDAWDLQCQNVERRIGFVKDKERQGVFDTISRQFEEVWSQMGSWDRDDEQYQGCKAHLKERIHPFICAGGLNNMVYDKPFGFAGDYLTIYNYFLHYSGERCYEIFINQYSRSIPVAVAHRNRIPLLVSHFEALGPKGGDVMAVGCGPAIEIQRASLTPQFSKNRFVLFDPDERAVTFVKTMLPEHVDNASFVSGSLLGLLKSLKRQNIEGGPKDLIYCCGLYDYLDDRLAGHLLRALFANLKQGGRMIVTNVVPEVSGRAYFELFADWNLIFRSGDDMLTLARENTPEAKASIQYDAENGANIYLYVEKA